MLGRKHVPRIGHVKWRRGLAMQQRRAAQSFVQDTGDGTPGHAKRHGGGLGSRPTEGSMLQFFKMFFFWFTKVGTVSTSDILDWVPASDIPD